MHTALVGFEWHSDDAAAVADARWFSTCSFPFRSAFLPLCLPSAHTPEPRIDTLRVKQSLQTSVHSQTQRGTGTESKHADRNSGTSAQRTAELSRTDEAHSGQTSPDRPATMRTTVHGDCTADATSMESRSSPPDAAASPSPRPLRFLHPG